MAATLYSCQSNECIMFSMFIVLLEFSSKQICGRFAGQSKFHQSQTNYIFGMIFQMTDTRTDIEFCSMETHTQPKIIDASHDWL